MVKRNPYSVPTKDTKQIRVHKDLVTVLNRERMKQQRISDAKFGKGKNKVSLAFSSKVLGGFLK